GGHEIPPGLHPEFEVRILGAHRGQQGIELPQIHARLITPLRHTESATDIDDFHFLEVLCDLGQLTCRVLPVGDIEDTATHVSLQPDDAQGELLRVAGELLELRDRYAEFRVCTGCAYMVMMATADPSVDPREDLPIPE